MNTRLVLKLGVVLAALLFMVLMGMSNQQNVKFSLSQLGERFIFTTNAAIMYFIFFGVGLMTGAVIAVGTGKPSSAPKGKG